VKPDIFGSVYSDIGIRILDVGDCILGKHHNISKIYANNRSCDFIKHLTGPIGDCIFVMPNTSIWTRQETIPTLRFLAVLHTHLPKNISSQRRVPLGRFLLFFWIQPDLAQQVLSSIKPWGFPQCNTFIIGTNGITLMNFQIKHLDKFKQICYDTSSRYVPYTRQARQRVCQYINSTFYSRHTIDCSKFADQKDEEKFTFLQFEMVLAHIYSQRFEEENFGFALLRVFYRLGGTLTVLIPVLTFLFGWLLTRWIFWKKRDAYYSDEVREAVVFFIEKERRLQKPKRSVQNSTSFSMNK
jgi:hypothetical protein